MRTLERRILALEVTRIAAEAFPSIADMDAMQLYGVMDTIDDMKECELLWLLGGEPDAEEVKHALA